MTCGRACKNAIGPVSLWFPVTRRLPDGDVEPVPDVDVGDGQDQRRQRPFVVVPGGVLPDLVGDRVLPIAQPGPQWR